ncbi:MAG: hypothetical protein IH600_10470 [Bacteroidetes bacterium]|nr:hypothetical protein [Bacteroidota bacterium]
MRYVFALSIALLLLTGPMFSQTIVTVTDTVLQTEVHRLGINVGARSQWSAAQHVKNLIDNPGFEAGDFASLVLVDYGATASTVPMANWDVAWNNDQYGVGWPEGFWTGAEYEILWGNAKGRSGHITAHRHESGRQVFDLDGTGPTPERMSVLLLRRRIPGIRGNTSIADEQETRPGSPGRQSMKLAEGGNIFRFYMDSYWRDGDRSAGKMLVIEGGYHFGIWAKAARDGDRLRVRFFREGEGSFLDETVSLTTQWQHIERDFTVPQGADAVRAYSDAEYHPILAFQLEAVGSGADIRVDDLDLHATKDVNPTAFTDSYVDRLHELQPGVLRFWGAELGASLESQIAEPSARRTNGYSPQGRSADSYAYSLHEFLALCAFVGADPWYVMPPTLSPAEITALVEYLAAPADAAHPWAERRAALGQLAPWTQVFPRMHIEYGNEMWGSGAGGDPFMGESVNGGVRLGAIAHDRFTLMRAAPFFDSRVMNLVIGGQAGYAGRQREIQQNSSAHDAVALAPYFGILNAWGSDEEIYGPLFAMPFQEVATGRMRESRGYIDEGAATDLSIYEINFHTTSGTASIDTRNDFLTGMGGAIALPLTMLVYQRDLGAIDQCAFSSLGYSFQLQTGQYARLWGMLRDVEATGRKRPTWLGVETVNKVIGGQEYRTVQSGDNPAWISPAVNGIDAPLEVRDVQSFAFADGMKRGLVLFNLSLDQEREVRLRLSDPPSETAMHYALTAASIHDDNEDSVMIVIDSTLVQDFSDWYAITLPPHSVHALQWDAIPIQVEDLHAPTGFHLTARQSASGSVEIESSIPAGVEGRLEVHDILGRRIAEIARALPGGQTHRNHWQPPAAGTYIVMLHAGSEFLSTKVVVVR